MQYHIKQASVAEIQLMIDWAAAEKWNPGLNDALAFSLIDPQGFFMGYLADEPVSCISTVKYSDEFGFLGLYIVKPEQRGKGLGYQIWQHAMKYAGEMNIGLDGVVAQQANYKKSGFKLAHNNKRYLLTQPVLKKDAVKHIIPAQQVSLSDIMQYDQTCFPCARQAFLTLWLQMNNAVSLVYFDKKIKGYGVIRQCQNGYKIGPLFADNYQIANELFTALVNTIADERQKIYLDIPETNAQAVKLVEGLKMEPVFATARMYTKQKPTIALDKIFGITSFEMG